MEKKETILIKEAAKLAGVSKDTIRRWADKGKIKSVRTEGKHRRIDYDSLRKYMINQKEPQEQNNKPCLIYARINQDDEEENLKLQVDLLEKYCVSNGWRYRKIIDKCEADNYNRSSIKKILQLITKESISRLVITNPDRLFLFGNEIIFTLCELHGVEVVIINEDKYYLYENELNLFINKITNIQF